MISWFVKISSVSSVTVVSYEHISAIVQASLDVWTYVCADEEHTLHEGPRREVRLLLIEGHVAVTATTKSAWFTSLTGMLLHFEL